MVPPSIRGYLVASPASDTRARDNFGGNLGIPSVLPGLEYVGISAVTLYKIQSKNMQSDSERSLPWGFT